MLKIGHRGAKGLAPENTLSSFQKAIDFKCDMIELDVRLTKDKRLIVIHDEKVNRTTNGRGLVEKKTLKQIKKLSIKKTEEVPTLKEVLNLVKKRVKINIELKGENTAKPLARLIKKSKWPMNSFMVSSFNWPELKKFRKLCPKIKTLILAENKKKDFLKEAREMKVYALNLPLKMLTKEKVKEYQKEGFKIFVWTINKKSDMKKLKLWKVDGITSDYPDRY